MRKFIPLKFVSQLLLLVALIVIVHGVHESAHAMQDSVLASGDSVITHGQPSAPQNCPCAPPMEHKDYDGCDTCINCACHAMLAVPQLVLNYNPIILDLRFSDPYQYLPEVFLPKFIPPQILA
jgi:hypothetical protein